MSLPASDWLPLLTAYEAKLVSIISTFPAAAFFIQSLGSSMSPSKESTHIIPFFNDTTVVYLAPTLTRTYNIHPLYCDRGNRSKSFTVVCQP